MLVYVYTSVLCAAPEGGAGGTTSEKSQVCIGFLRNTGMYLLRRNNGTLRVPLLLEGSPCG